MENDSPAATAPKLTDALKRGVMCRCPACGKGRLFGRFLKPVAACDHCGRDWTIQRADDFPAYLVILLLGHLLVPIVVAANMRYALPMGAQMIGWPIVTAILALLMIQPMKGFVIALIWAR